MCEDRCRSRSWWSGFAKRDGWLRCADLVGGQKLEAKKRKFRRTLAMSGGTIAETVSIQFDEGYAFAHELLTA
jgi:hypothetical protein